MSLPAVRIESGLGPLPASSRALPFPAVTGLSPSLTLGSSMSTPASPSFCDALLRAHCRRVCLSDSPLSDTHCVPGVKVGTY